MSEAKEQNSAGKIKKIEDIGDAQVMAPGNGQQQQQQGGLRAMTEKDVNDYMETLLSSQQPPPGMPELELGALGNFKQSSIRQGDVERQLTRTQNQVEELKARINQLSGETRAYVNILVAAEDSRRAAAKGRPAERQE